MLTGTPCNLHPSSALYGLGYTPDYVCYHELVMTHKEFMRTVTAVDAEWLAKLGPMFFSVKESYEARIAKRQKERDSKAGMEEDFKTAVDAEVEERKRRRDAEEAATPLHRRGTRMATPGGAGGIGTRELQKQRGRKKKRFGM